MEDYGRSSCYGYIFKSYRDSLQVPAKNEGESKLSGKVTMEYLKQLKDLRKRYNKANKYKVEIWSEDKMLGR